MKTKILITGGSGALGQYLNIELSKHNEALTLYNKHKGNCGSFNSEQIDITDFNKLTGLIDSFRPDIVIHTAAISSPANINSTHSSLIYKINVETTAKIAELCFRINARLIYTSTDLVYAGYRGSMLKEDAKLIPISLYAETKLMGEVKIQETLSNYIILRTATLYGLTLNEAGNHFNTVYNTLKAGKPVKLFYDQFRTPLSLLDAARIIAELCSIDVKGEIINFGGRKRVSRLQLGEMLCGIAGLDKRLIKKISMSDLPNLPVVTDVSMNTGKLQSYGIKQMSIEDSIKKMIHAVRDT